MSGQFEKLQLSAEDETEDMINFVFRELPDEIVDQIELERLSPEGGGVARELITTAAILTFSSTLALPVFRLIEKWMENKREERSLELIYRAAQENPSVVKILADLEKHHADVAVKLVGSGFRFRGAKQT